MDVRKTIDNVGRLIDCVNELTTSDVLVGVPAAKAARGGPINNAELARVHEFGSPAHNIPARPFLFPAVRRVRPQVVALMKQAAKDCLTGGGASVDVVLNKVGLLARNAAVKEITDPSPAFAPLKPATIRARLRRTAAGRRKLRNLAKVKAAAGWRSGNPALEQWASETVMGDMNIHPLIDTGALRASLSYVVRKT